MSNPSSGVDPETNTVTPPIPGPYAPAEPLMTRASFVALVAAVLGVVVAFGPDLTEKQTTAVLGLALVLAPLVVALLARSKVWSPQTVRATVLAERAKAAREVQPPPASPDVPPAGGVW